MIGEHHLVQIIIIDNQVESLIHAFRNQCRYIYQNCHAVVADILGLDEAEWPQDKDPGGVLIWLRKIFDVRITNITSKKLNILLF